MANFITILRIILLFIGISFIYSYTFHGELIAFIIILSVIIMDWLDGYIARKRNITTQFGAVIDILGDRIVENSLWIVFAHIHLIPVWVPLIVIVRGFVTDSMRSVALAKGKTPFGENTMIRTEIGRLIVSSKLSRGIYGVAKVLTFCYLILYLAYLGALKVHPYAVFSSWQGRLYTTGLILVYFTIVICVLRAIPVISDSWYYFKNNQ
ncbi:MAG TPA: CDP-alcohol phosphatidyltransferase family protein [Nitrospiraceae bacterium]|nr:MAG: hypothetical protein A2Z60_03215 [Nitrospirae bacterium RIFCSPLOWO2_02_42_7]OGW59254.1 MAG: hypothetical protein A3D21_03310 [Nitrospirae bacterium RIFCSPHIGHO2_02_FULL_42_12]HBI23246.1 CDP-alcohol phosphatidyltransferase family protein [Nitrospiraceae bacterium]